MRVIKGAHVVALGRTRNASNARLHGEIGLTQATSLSENLLCAMLLVVRRDDCDALHALTCCGLDRLQQRVLPLGQYSFGHHGRVLLWMWVE
jgi:hypothetical protein